MHYNKPILHTQVMLTLTKPEAELFLKGKTAISDYLGNLVIEALSNDASAADGLAAMMRHLYLLGQEDRDDSYLFQFQSKHGIPFSPYGITDVPQ